LTARLRRFWALPPPLHPLQVFPPPWRRLLGHKGRSLRATPNFPDYITNGDQSHMNPFKGEVHQPKFSRHAAMTLSFFSILRPLVPLSNGKLLAPPSHHLFLSKSPQYGAFRTFPRCFFSTRHCGEKTRCTSLHGGFGWSGPVSFNRPLRKTTAKTVFWGWFSWAQHNQ